MLILVISPSTRIIGGKPAEMCKSEALFLNAKRNKSSIDNSFAMIVNPTGG